MKSMFALLAIGSACALAQAQQPAPAPKAGCIELKSVAEVEETARDDKGQSVVRRTPAAKVVPGTEVIWTLSAANVCAAPAEAVYIDNPVPEHMSYVADSARGAGAVVSYSLDGKSFAAPEALMVKEADGQVRVARAAEYRHIRWSFQAPIKPGQLAAASFRALVR